MLEDLRPVMRQTATAVANCTSTASYPGPLTGLQVQVLGRAPTRPASHEPVRLTSVLPAHGLGPTRRTPCERAWLSTTPPRAGTCTCICFLFRASPVLSKESEASFSRIRTTSTAPGPAGRL